LSLSIHIQRAYEIRVEKIKETAQKAQNAAILAGRGFMDALDALDKAILDQDDDEIEVGEDEADEVEVKAAKKARKEELKILSGGLKKLYIQDSDDSDSDGSQKKHQKKHKKKGKKLLPKGSPDMDAQVSLGLSLSLRLMFKGLSIPLYW